MNDEPMKSEQETSLSAEDMAGETAANTDETIQPNDEPTGLGDVSELSATADEAADESVSEMPAASGEAAIDLEATTIATEATADTPEESVAAVVQLDDALDELADAVDELDAEPETVAEVETASVTADEAASAIAAEATVEAEAAVTTGGTTVEAETATVTAPEPVVEAKSGNEEALPKTVQYGATGEADKLPEPANAFEGAVQNAMRAGEAAESRHPIVAAFDRGVKAIIGATNVTPQEIQEDLAHDHDPDGHSDTVTVPFLGTITVYGGIYTVIFGVLAALTALEVAVAELFPGGTFSIVALLGAAIAKAALVMAFYMHLRQDNPLFRLVLALPIVVTLLSVLYLLGVPTGAGLGYN